MFCKLLLLEFLVLNRCINSLNVYSSIQIKLLRLIGFCIRKQKIFSKLDSYPNEIFSTLELWQNLGEFLKLVVYWWLIPKCNQLHNFSHFFCFQSSYIRSKFNCILVHFLMKSFFSFLASSFINHNQIMV